MARKLTLRTGGIGEQSIAEAQIYIADLIRQEKVAADIGGIVGDHSLEAAAADQGIVQPRGAAARAPSNRGRALETERAEFPATGRT